MAPEVLISLGFSLLALVISALSLGWQAYTWARNGPVLKVDVGWSFTVPQGTRLVSVTVRNVGRAAATVQGYGLRLPDGHQLVVFDPLPWAPRLPARLEAHDSLSLPLVRDDVQATLEERGRLDVPLRAFVTLGNGRTILSRKTVKVS